NESGLTFIEAGTSDMKAGYMGQSAQKVHDLFERARSKAPSILFIDEFDSSAAARGSSYADQYTNDIVNELLKQMDGVKKTTSYVFVVAATNFLNRIDDAIMSRFTFKIEVPYPDEQQREQLFKIALAKLERVDFNIDEMAAELAHLTGEISGRAI